MSERLVNQEGIPNRSGVQHLGGCWGGFAGWEPCMSCCRLLILRPFDRVER